MKILKSRKIVSINVKINFRPEYKKVKDQYYVRLTPTIKDLKNKSTEWYGPFVNKSIADKLIQKITNELKKKSLK